jgi:hypothetical protein
MCCGNRRVRTRRASCLTHRRPSRSTGWGGAKYRWALCKTASDRRMSVHDFVPRLARGLPSNEKHAPVSASHMCLRVWLSVATELHRARRRYSSPERSSELQTMPHHRAGWAAGVGGQAALPRAQRVADAERPMFGGHLVPNLFWAAARRTVGEIAALPRESTGLGENTLVQRRRTQYI